MAIEDCVGTDDEGQTVTKWLPEGWKERLLAEWPRGMVMAMPSSWRLGVGRVQDGPEDDLVLLVPVPVAKPKPASRMAWLAVSREEVRFDGIRGAQR